MSNDKTLANPRESEETIIPGTVVGGRIKVERIAREGPMGSLLFARDVKTRKSIALHVMSPRTIDKEDQFEILRQEIKNAAKLQHRNIVSTYGIGTYAKNTHFVACEWVDGVALSDFITQRSKAGNIISVRGAYNIIAHICKALTKAHEIGIHGALRPSTLWITKSGRVKISNFGISLALLKSGQWRLLEEQEKAYLSPEIKLGKPADSLSDIFGIGAILYVLLTFRSPIEDFVPPSKTHPDATRQLDEILMKCLSADPKARYSSPKEISQALLPLVADTPEPKPDEFGVDIEIDIDIATSLAPPPAPSVQLLRHDKPANPPNTTNIKPRSAVKLHHFDHLPNTETNSPIQTSKSHANSKDNKPEHKSMRQSEVDLNNLMSQITENDAPRWMVVKNNLDHGPFSGRELVKLIINGEVLADHILLNIDTGERKKIKESAEFVEFLEQQRIRKSEQEYQQALVQSTKIEKRANIAKFLILSSGIAAIVLVGTIYLITRETAKKEETADIDLASLFESGQVKISGTADILQFRRTGRRRGGRRSSNSNQKAGGSFSYENAMNQAMELGDVSRGGGEKQLTSRDIAGVMNKKLNSLFSCVSKELRTGGHLSTVRIDLAIAGNGNIMGATVQSGSATFKSCIIGKVRRIKFPSFPAPRMGARYSFNVD